MWTRLALMVVSYLLRNPKVRKTILDQYKDMTGLKKEKEYTFEEGIEILNKKRIQPAYPLPRPTPVPRPKNLPEELDDMEDILKEYSKPTTGYDKLKVIFDQAFERANSGKGRIRHGQDNADFLDQYIMRGQRRFGKGAALFQAYKKVEESVNLDWPRARNELLDSIVYVAAAIIRGDEEAEDIRTKEFKNG